MKLEFFRQVKICIFIKVRPVKAELFHADRLTHVTKPVATFRNFSKAPKAIVKRLVP
jgi:hypothetical protein